MSWLFCGGRSTALTEVAADEKAKYEARIKELEAHVSKLEQDLKEKDTKEEGEKAKRRSSVAKLQTIQATMDDDSQAYIKSQFLSRLSSHESGSSSPLDKMRRKANLVMAANTFKAAAAVAETQGASSSGTTAPAAARPAHPAYAKVPAHLAAGSLTDAELDMVVNIVDAMEAADWTADVLTLCRLLTHPMAFVVSLVLRQWSAAEALGVEQAVIDRMLVALEDGYLPTNPYHNATHAADVAFTTHVMLHHGVREALSLSNLQCVVCVIAAAAHDFRHPGIGATFLIATSADLAVTYNDRSPLENMHTSEFFRMLCDRPELNVFGKLDRKAAASVRKAIITMIMATDMSVHFDYLDRFQKRFPAPLSGSEGEGEGEGEGCGNGGGGAASGKEPLSEDDQNFAVAMLLHCSDISNPAKPFAAYADWTDRVLAEFYHQGVAEGAAGLNVSPFFDRAKPGVGKMQTGFINFIVRPIFTAWTDFVPSLAPICLPHLDANAKVWTADTPYIPPEQPFVSAAKTDWDWEKGEWR